MVQIPVVIRDLSLLQNIRQSLGPTQLPIQLVPGFLPRIKSAWAKSSTLKSGVKKERIYTSVPPTYLHGVNRHNFTFTFTHSFT